MPLQRERPGERRWQALGGLLSLAVVTAAVVFASGGVAFAQPATQPSPALVAQGQQIYLQSCASCHGAQGLGSANAPALTNVGTASWAFQLRTGRMPLSEPNAPAYRQEPAFTPGQIEALLAFAATITTGPEIPQVNVANGDVRQGWAAFIQNCAACHAATGAGDSVGGGFIAPSLLASDPETIGEAILTGPGAMPPFPFLEPQLDSIAAYILSLQGAAADRGGFALGGLGPVAEGFVAVFIGLGALVVIARWIGRPPRHDEPGAP